MIKFKDILYTQPNFEVLKNSFKALTQAFEAEKDATQLYAIFQQINQMQTDFRTAYHLAYILNAADSSVESHQQKVQYFDTYFPQFHELMCQFYRVLLQHPQRSAIENKIGKQYLAIAAKKSSTSSPKLIPLQQEENKVLGEYRKNLSKQTMPYEGKEIPIWKIYPLLRSLDQNTRKKASTALLESQYKSAPRLETTFEQLVQIRHNMAEMKNYTNFVELGCIQMQRNGYGTKDINHFNQLIQQYFAPLLKKMNLKRIKRLNIKEEHHYDYLIQFSDGNAKMKKNIIKDTTLLQTLFSTIAPELGCLFNDMLKNGYVDIETRKNKYPGAFKITIPNHNVSYILTNSSGEVGDIDFIVHEMGHAFQVHKSKDYNEKAFEYIYASSDLAEIHSTTLEFFALPHYGLFFDKKNLPKAYTVFFNRIINSLLKASAYETFQQKVYSNPNSGISERNDYWKSIRQKYFPSINKKNKGEHPYLQSGKGWQNVGHIFMRPFYMIDYGLAYICAIQFWMRSEQEGFEVAWRDYVRLCEKGGSISFLEALDLMGFGSPFEEETIRKIAGFLEGWVERLSI